MPNKNYGLTIYSHHSIIFVIMYCIKYYTIINLHLSLALSWEFLQGMRHIKNRFCIIL